MAFLQTVHAWKLVDEPSHECHKRDYYIINSHSEENGKIVVRVETAHYSLYAQIK